VQPIRASFLGIGAPEAVLVGVVALVIFGPKGLAQAAKSLGATLRAFAPTIRELTQVSTELRSTLEQEIGFNDLKDELTRPAALTPRPARSLASTVDSDEEEVADGGSESGELSALAAKMRPVDDAMAVAIDPEIEKKREESMRMAWGGAAPAVEAGDRAAPAAPSLETLSLEELEAELLRRRKTGNGSVPQQLGTDD
jgi:TatA/E family protein of Tat protein translocase